MTDNKPETPQDDARPVSMRNETPHKSGSQNHTGSNQTMYLIMTAAIFLLAGLLIASLLSSSDDNSINKDELRDTVEEAVGAQLAALPTNAPVPSVTPFDEAALDAKVQDAVSSALSTQAAELQPVEINENGTLDQADLEQMVYEAIGTQIADIQPEDLEQMVADAVGTQAADLAPTAEPSGDTVSEEQMQAMVEEAVGTQVAALIPTNTPVPPTPTRIPNPVADDGDAFLGPADAPVVIVEFSDFQCGYCGKFYDETLPFILEKYPDEVKFVYRDFPIFGEDSLRGAMAAECAEDQGKFWEMHNRLFAIHDTPEQEVLDEETLIGFADELGLDTTEFSECLSSERYLEEVLTDGTAAQAYGLRGTPGFIINGVVYAMGAQPFDVFDAIIQDELSRIGE
jgi:protein-disulfide isomerase